MDRTTASEFVYPYLCTDEGCADPQPGQWASLSLCRTCDLLQRHDSSSSLFQSIGLSGVGNHPWTERRSPGLASIGFDKTASRLVFRRVGLPAESTSYRSGYAEHTRGQQYGWFRPVSSPKHLHSSLLGDLRVPSPSHLECSVRPLTLGFIRDA